MIDASTAASSSVLAFVTVIHVALLLLCRHRNVHQLGDIWLLLPSVALAGVPWMLATPPWLAAGLVTHLAWFVACERLVPKPAATRVTSTPQPQPVSPRPQPTSRPSPASARPTEPAAARTTSTDFHPAPVLAVFTETDDIKTFRLARPEGFSFKPGQFLMVRVQVDGRPLVRCYSICSAPEITGYLEISVKRLGVVSSTLHATLRPGSMLAIKGPAGEFTYPDGDDRPVVFIAGGVGITPLASMLRHGLLADPGRPMTFLYSVRDERQIAYQREFAWIAERFPHARVSFVVADGPHEIGHFSGFITENVIREVVDDVVNSIYMLCGPPPMMDAMKKVLGTLGVGESQVRHELFEAAVALADQKPAAKQASNPAAKPTARPAAAFELTLRKSGLNIPVTPQQSLLEAVEAGGGALPHSCRAGVCLTCRTRLIEGDVDSQSEGLDSRDRADGFILPCVSWAKSDCTLDA